MNNLAEQEGTSENKIGFVSMPDNNSRCKIIPSILPQIKSWAKRRELDAVVWTDLPSNFKEKTKLEFNEDNVVKYLRGLKGQALRIAEAYVRKTPKQIVTNVRRTLRQEFGW